MVDDEPFNLMAMETILRQAGVRIGLDPISLREKTDFVSSGRIALDRIYGGEVYSLIITDISMPLMDGYELTKGILDIVTARRGIIPYIVACTGHVEEMYIKKAWNYGINEILSKPAKIEILAEILEECILDEA